MRLLSTSVPQALRPRNLLQLEARPQRTTYVPALFQPLHDGQKRRRVIDDERDFYTSALYKLYTSKYVTVRGSRRWREFRRRYRISRRAGSLTKVSRVPLGLGPGPRSPGPGRDFPLPSLFSLPVPELWQSGILPFQAPSYYHGGPGGTVPLRGASQLGDDDSPGRVQGTELEEQQQPSRGWGLANHILGGARVRRGVAAVVKRWRRCRGTRATSCRRC